MRPLTLKEIQQEALNILLRFDKICQDNHFNYFLYFGTLIGAIRHNGFIPWDDDLDVMMPRNDFDKFVKYAKENSEELLPFKLCDRSNTNNYVYGIPRFANLQYRYVDERQYVKPYDIGTFIDIYPLDNFCNTEEEAAKLYVECRRMNQVFSWYKNPSTGSGVLRTICKYCLYFYLKVRYRQYEKIIDEKIKEHILSRTSDNNNYVGLVAWVGKFVLFDKNKLQKLETERHLFEGHMFPVPKCYDYILTKIYGNYMELPPEDERIRTHSYKIYKR